MLSDEIRTRLSRLHRSEFATLASSGIAVAGPRPAAPADIGRFAGFLFEHAEECENASGKHLRFRRPLTDFWPAVDACARRVLESDAPRPAAAAHPELAAVAEHFPRDTLFLDLETCGFAGSSVFLAGLIWQADGSLIVDQLFARHYAEERALLETLWQVARENRVLVTFNGKSFDWPMVHDRSTRYHLGQDVRGQTTAAPAASPASQAMGRHDARPQLTHCDLLHHARRRWKRLLPNCKLQTLERYVCNRRRLGDLGGALVPAAYHEFVRTGNARPLGAILHHNALDLATLVQVTLKLLSA